MPNPHRESIAMHALLFIALIVAPALALEPPSRPAASEPTLARFSFWVKSERMDEFEALYQDEIRPYLS